MIVTHTLSAVFQAGPHQRGWADVLESVNEFYRRVLFLPEQASTVAAQIDHLHYLEITVMFAAAGAIALAVIIFLARYHHAGNHTHIDLLDEGDTRDPTLATPHVNAPLVLEFGLYAGLFGLFVLFWVLGYRQYVELLVPPTKAIDIFVTGKQWVWQFAYPQGPATAGILYVPAGQPVRIVLTSRDVIHSFFVPQFRVKRDAVPGMYTETWFEASRPGTYNVLCAELCGVGHSVMRAGVIVLDPQDFQRWLEGRSQFGADVPDTTGASLAQRGRIMAIQKGCARCHSVDGSRATGPTWRNLYGSWEVLEGGQRVFVDEAYITRSMMEPGRDIVAGFPNVMPSFMGLVAPGEVSALVAYMRSLSDAPVDRATDSLPGERGPNPASVRALPPASPAPADTTPVRLPR